MTIQPVNGNFGNVAPQRPDRESALLSKLQDRRDNALAKIESRASAAAEKAGGDPEKAARIAEFVDEARAAVDAKVQDKRDQLLGKDDPRVEKHGGGLNVVA